MGLFGKKKSKDPPAEGGSYVAPALDDNCSSDEDMVKIDKDSIPDDLEENGKVTPKNKEDAKETDLEKGEKDGSSVSIMPNPYSQVTATLESPQPTYDDATVVTKSTYQTKQTFGTYPTLQTADTGETKQTKQTFVTYATVKTTDTTDTKDSAFTITRNGQYLTLNGFANGHLMRWKFASEEGPTIIRILALLLALSTIGCCVYAIVTDWRLWTISDIITFVHTTVFCSFIIVLDGRAVGVRGPTHLRARVRGILTRYFNILRLLWGRGLLYMFVGSLVITMDFYYIPLVGIPMILLGLIALASGAHASYNLDRMKSSLTDEAYLWAKFECNSDQEGVLNLDGFAELLWNLGLEFDDVYTYKAFQQIDKDGDGKISFEGFKDWWIVTQNDGRTLRGGNA